MSRLLFILLSVLLTSHEVESQTSQVNTSSYACGLSQELPIVTNIDQPAGASMPTVKYLAADQMRLATTPFPSYFSRGGCYYTFGPGLVSTTDRYVAAQWDIEAISNATALDFVTQSCQKTGVAAKFLRPDAVTPTTSGGNRIVDNAGYTQIIHGLTDDRSMYTVVLPPGWRRDAAPGTYPILFWGMYGVNQDILNVRTGDYNFVNLISESAKRGSPTIGVYWNGAGGFGSHNFTAYARVLFDRLVNNVIAPTFHGDVDRIVMKGVSRGAITGLLMAGNPDPHHYTVRYVFGADPSVSLGRDSQFIGGSTFTAYLPLFDNDIGLYDAWTPGWSYPSCAGHPELEGLTATQAFLKIITGYTDPKQVDEVVSPIAPRMISALKAAGTRLFLQISTNDPFMPFGSSQIYLRKLREAGIPFETQYLVLSGHNWDQDAGDARVLDAITALAHGGQPVASNAVSFEKVDRPNGRFVPWSPAGNKPPFTLTVPRITTPQLSAHIYATGTPGTDYHLELKKRETGEVFSGQSTIGQDFDDVLKIAPPSGTYDFLSLKIKEPGEVAWKYLSLRDTPTATAERLSMKSVAPFSAMPATRVNAILNKDFGYIHGVYPIAAWGIANISPPVPEGQVDFRVTVQYVDGSGQPRELISSASNPVSNITIKPGTPYSTNVEEIGVDHKQPVGCSLLNADGTKADCVGVFFATANNNSNVLQSGPYVFSFTYGGSVYVRTINVALQ